MAFVTKNNILRIGVEYTVGSPKRVIATDEIAANPNDPLHGDAKYHTEPGVDADPVLLSQIFTKIMALEYGIATSISITVDGVTIVADPPA
jgi:hypothetical protein